MFISQKSAKAFSLCDSPKIFLHPFIYFLLLADSSSSICLIQHVNIMTLQLIEHQRREVHLTMSFVVSQANLKCCMLLMLNWKQTVVSWFVVVVVWFRLCLKVTHIPTWEARIILIALSSSMMLAVGIAISSSKDVLCAVPFPDICLTAETETSTWFSELTAEFHTYMTPVLESAGHKYLCRTLLKY